MPRRNVIALAILTLLLGAALAEPLEDFVGFAEQGAWLQFFDGQSPEWVYGAVKAVARSAESIRQ